MTDTVCNELRDVYDHAISIETLDAHKAFGSAVAAIHVDADDPWCPNALQLRALRDRCNAILAQHVAKDVDPGPYRIVRLGDVGAEIIKIESGSDIHGAPSAAVIRIDIEGNEEGPAWVGDLDALAHLASTIDDVWDRYNPPPETVVKSLAKAVFERIKEAAARVGDAPGLFEAFRALHHVPPRLFAPFEASVHAGVCFGRAAASAAAAAEFAARVFGNVVFVIDDMPQPFEALKQNQSDDLAKLVRELKALSADASPRWNRHDLPNAELRRRRVDELQTSARPAPWHVARLPAAQQPRQRRGRRHA